MKHVLFWVVIFFSLINSGTATSQAMNKGDFYNRDAEGWFWYIDPERVEDEKPEPEKPKPKSDAPKDKKKERDGPPPLSTAWLRVNLDKFRDLAIDNPTQENVAAYFYLQRYAMDKAQAFAEMARMVVTTDPLLDENTRKPIASFGSMTATREAKENSDELVKRIGEKAGIIFFYHSECSYCEIQVPVLNALKNKFNFAITAISLDGKPMPNGSFPDYKTDTGQAEKLGVMATPAMYLIEPPNKVVNLAQGVISMSEINSRIVTVGGSMGLVSKEEMETTKSSRSDMLMDTSISAAWGMGEEEQRDTRKMVEFMRSLYSSGASSPVRKTLVKGEDKNVK